MSISAHWYTLALSLQYSGSPINWTSDTIKVALVTSSYTPAQDTDQYWSVPQANEISGTGYTAGGIALSGKSVGTVVSPHEIPLLASNISWTTATFSCSFAVVYKNTGTPSTSPVMGYVDFGGAESVTSGTFALNFDPTNGVLAFQAT